MSTRKQINRRPVHPVDAPLAAYECHASEMAALEPSELVAVNLDIPLAVTTVLGAVPAMNRLRATLVRIEDFDGKAFDALPTYSLAPLHAHTEYVTAAAPAADVVELNERATHLRNVLLSDARALVTRGLLDPNHLTGLKLTVGYRNVAVDLLALAKALLDQGKAVEGKSALRHDEFEQARALGTQLIFAVANREQAPNAANEAADMRQRAYTLFYRTYEEARVCIHFVRRREGDGESFAPSLCAGRGGHRTKGADQPTDPVPVTSPAAPAAPSTTPSTTPPATPTAPAADARAPNGTPAAELNTAVGMPGSSPFL